MDRFFNKIDKSDDGCWNWKAGSRCKNGYGAFKINGKTIDAHRMSFIIHKGEIPEGMLVCHTCDNRKCVNPEHLFLGTYSDNMKDCSKKNRLYSQNVPKKHPSFSAYNNGCRCSECRQLHSDNLKQYRKDFGKSNKPEKTGTFKVL